MPYKAIQSVRTGMIVTESPVNIPNTASPNISGMFIKDGIVQADIGHTAYPTAGATKTNLVHGVPNLIKEFVLTSGVSHLVVFTTTNVYEYNTSTTTWDNITRGQELDDAEDAWTASTNVTCTADTATKLRDSKSAKMAIGASFTTGLAAYFDLAGTPDISEETAIHVWVYSTVATAAGDLKFRISDAVSGGTGGNYEDLSIPALDADTWTPVCVDIGTPANYSSLASIGLVVSTDLGAMDVYIDDVRSVKRYTGDADNLWSVGVLNDTLIATNGVDQPQKYGGTVATGLQDLTTTLASGAITSSEIVIIAKDHVVFFNNTENAADAPQRASWGDIGEIEVYTGGTSGYQDLVDDESWIIAVAQLSDNVWLVYKEKQIVRMEWVGGHTPFRFTTVVTGKTIAGKNCVYSTDAIHFVIGTHVIYAYAGGEDVQHIDHAVNTEIFDGVDYTYIGRSFIIWNEGDDEFQFWFPFADTYPDTIYCLVLKGEERIWYKRKRTMSGYGWYSTSSSLTIGELPGTIGELNFRIGDALSKANTPIVLLCDPSINGICRINAATLNNGGTAITNTYETPDFIIPSGEEDKVYDFFRVMQLVIEVAGQSVICEYSTDSGSTWNPTQGNGENTISLSSVFDWYQQDFDSIQRKIRFRLQNTSVSSGFKLRRYGFMWKERSSR